MKSYNYLFILFLVPLLLTGCTKSFPDSNQSDNRITEDSGQTANGTGAAAAPNPAETITEPSSAETSAIETAGQTDSASGGDSYKARARELLSGMTPEEKVGQMFFVRLRKNSAIEDIKNYHPGGYILFGDDFKDETKTSIRELIKSYQISSPIPLLIGVDEEGGTVCRVSKYTAFRNEPFKSPQDLYKQGGFEAIQADTREKAALLLGLGINVNLAPVCDVSTDPNDFIYRRSFGREAGATADYVRTVIEEMKKERIGSTLKHFPGYGSNADTHTGAATDNRDYDQFVRSDFLPFRAGMEAGADSVLVSHNIVTSMDEKYPASLSPAVHEILRESFHFEGVIMTDDLSMDAIKNETPDVDSAVLAITAGNDLLVATDFDTQIPAVLNALNNGTLKEERIDASVIRILVWKLRLGILK
ncbi:glycoside hydrolase family 3 protein [Clostridium sp. Marseille-P2415]|uniref:glycoside hydrolase family 3 protein n=1 Tax=Clostridium sp. Marseille-P2415 TaxID=1805471 RepID=UPI0009888F07|nr:glycoside hydrolase family 3 N-terminal domain-containing protein [Clostridium sp. Marseille-P2415]